MKKLFLTPCIFSVVATLIPAAGAQPRTLAQAQPVAVAQGANQDVATRSRDLSRLFNDIWQDKLRHEPEYATYLGDKRYDAELTDYSPRAINDGLARERSYIERLSAID